MWAVWGWIRPHKAEMAWHPKRRRWVCSTCNRRVRFGIAVHGGTLSATEPFHKFWWRG